MLAAPYRTGAVIRLLWSGIGAFLREHQYGYLVGTASVGTRDGGRFAASVYLRMAAECMASGAFAVTPRVRFPIEQATPYLDPDIPPLINGYMRAGGRVCGAPAWDRAFGTADFLMLLDLRELAPGHARRFISDDGSTENARPPRRSPEREVALVV